jgi:hypothetical protein
MTTTAKIRVRNLRTLMEQWGGPTSLATKLGHANGSYLSQMAGPNPTREVSEKVARKVEKILSLPFGWLDTQHTGLPQEVNTDLLIDTIDMTKEIMDKTGLKLSRDKFTQLVNLAYERAVETGAPNQALIKQLISLMK